MERASESSECYSYVYKNFAPEAGAVVGQPVWTATGLDFRHEQRFYLQFRVHTDREAHPASFPLDIGCFPGAKRLGRQTDHPSPYNGAVMNALYFNSVLMFRSRVSSVSLVFGYGLDDRAIGVRSPAGAKDFSSILCVQTGSGAHPASCTMGTGGPFPGGKSAAGAWCWPPLPPSASMACSGTALPFYLYS
jgi:hypothetical protein